VRELTDWENEAAFLAQQGKSTEEIAKAMRIKAGLRFELDPTVRDATVTLKSPPHHP